MVGVGRDGRGDDEVGLWVAREIGSLGLEDLGAVTAVGDASALVELWRGAGSVFVVDAVLSSSPPGTIHRLDAWAERLPRGLRCRSSTHALGVAEAVELARVLGWLPQSLVVYGISGKRFEPGRGISTEVRRAAREVVRRIVEECRPTER